jgi:amidase
MCRDIVGRMAAYDAWLCPVVPMVPRKIGYYDMSLDVDDYNATIMGPDCAFTAPFNATGLPGMSLPLHWTEGGLPVGVQLVGRDLDEALLLRLAGQLEQAQPWGERVPPVNAGA